MGCGKSKHDVATGNTHSKYKRNKNSNEPREENAKMIQEQQQKGGLQAKSTKFRVVQKEEVVKSGHLKDGNERKLGSAEEGVKEKEWANGGDLAIERLICDGISGKTTEYYSPKRSSDAANCEYLEGGSEREVGKGEESVKVEKEWVNDDCSADFSVEGIICDGISGKTEYYSPKKSNDEDLKDGNGRNVDLGEESVRRVERDWVNDDNNGNTSVEGVICDGISGITEYSPKKLNDENCEDLKEGNEKEVDFVEGSVRVEKERVNDDFNGVLSVEGVICDGISGKTEYYSPKKSNDDGVEGKELFVENETETMIHDGTVELVEVEEKVEETVSLVEPEAPLPGEEVGPASTAGEEIGPAAIQEIMSDSSADKEPKKN